MSVLEPRKTGLALVGYRGTGKSTVGRIVAEKSGRAFTDLDAEVESNAGRSIASIFAQEGESRFREWESDVLRDLVERVEVGVLATGGGAILREANRTLLTRFGLVVWLTADAATLALRLQKSSRGIEARPSLTSAGTLAEIAAVLQARTPWYREVARVEVSTEGRTAEQVADLVIQAWSDPLRIEVLR